MKKFILLYVGMWQHSPEVMSGWTKWFQVLGDRVVDSGNPFGPGREVTTSGSVSLPQDKDAIVGYTIIKAENMEEVEKLLKECPIITSVKIYEAMPM